MNVFFFKESSNGLTHSPYIINNALSRILGISLGVYHVHAPHMNHKSNQNHLYSFNASYVDAQDFSEAESRVVTAGAGVP